MELASQQEHRPAVACACVSTELLPVPSLGPVPGSHDQDTTTKRLQGGHGAPHISPGHSGVTDEHHEPSPDAGHDARATGRVARFEIFDLPAILFEQAPADLTADCIS